MLNVHSMQKKSQHTDVRWSIARYFGILYLMNVNSSLKIELSCRVGTDSCTKLVWTRDFTCTSTDIYRGVAKQKDGGHFFLSSSRSTSLSVIHECAHSRYSIRVSNILYMYLTVVCLDLPIPLLSTFCSYIKGSVESMTFRVYLFYGHSIMITLCQLASL